MDGPDWTKKKAAFVAKQWFQTNWGFKSRRRVNTLGKN